MVLALIVVAAIINIIAKNNNYYIKAPTDSDFDIRVKRCASVECATKNQIQFIKKNEDLLENIEKFEENHVEEVLEKIKIGLRDEYMTNKATINRNKDDVSASPTLVRRTNLNDFKHILNLANKQISNRKNTDDFNGLNEKLVNKIDYAVKRLVLKLEKANNNENKTILSEILLKEYSKDKYTNIFKKDDERYKRKASLDGYFTSLYNNIYSWFWTKNSTDKQTEHFNNNANNYSYNDYYNQSRNNRDLRYQEYTYSPSYNQNYATNNDLRNNYHNGYYYPVNNNTGLYDPAYNLGYSPYNYNNGYNNQLNYKYWNDLNSSKNHTRYNNNPTGYNHNPTDNSLLNGYTNNIANIKEVNANNTTTEETIIIEGCVLCGSFGCPTNFKRIGFKCVPK
ncbi:unnamed protein product, partial [Brenthis ino]